MSKKIKIHESLFGTLIGRLRERQVGFTTWKIEGKFRVYTGRHSRKIIREEIQNLEAEKPG